MTDPAVPGGFGRITVRGPRSGDRAALRIHQPRCAGLSDHGAPLRDDVTVDKYGVDFGVSLVSRPDARVAGLVIRRDPVVAERFESGIGKTVFARPLRGHDRPGGPGELAAFHAADILVIDAVVRVLPAGVARLRQLVLPAGRLRPPVVVECAAVARNPFPARTDHHLIGQVAAAHHDAGPEEVAAVVTGRNISVVPVPRIELEGEADLFEVAFTGSSAGVFPRLVQRRKQHGGENGDDCDDDQELDQSETSSHFLLPVQLQLATIPLKKTFP